MALSPRKRTPLEHARVDVRATDPKAEKKAAKAAKKRVKAEQKGEHGRVTPSNAKKAVGIAKVIGPAVAPYLAQAAGATRAAYDRFKAHQLGVPVDELARFSGKGAALHARIAGDSDALRDLLNTDSGEEDASARKRFVDSAQDRLRELSGAVRAAERMPASRRRAAHRAVHGELNRIEDDLLHRFGV